MMISNIGYRLKVIGYRLLVIVFLLSPFTSYLSPLSAQIGMRELGDSLMAWTGFSRVWSPTVRVKQMRIDGNNVTLKTNMTLKDVRWTPQNIAEVKRKVSVWTLGHPNGKVTIYSGTTDIETLITDCARKGQMSKCPTGNCKDLTDRQIVVYPSHGLYFNRDRNEWIWQRATLWTTVEDLYSQEYVRLVKQMLENAGASVLMPRAGLDQQELGQSGMPKWTEGARYWLIDQKADPELWDLYEGNEYKDDMKCRAMWVNSLDTPVDLCLAFHTDGQDSGNDSTIIGTLVIYTAKDDEGNTTLRDGRDREKVNRNLADWIQTQVTEDLRTIAPEWTRRQLKEANYCETRVPVVPSIILELLSHKNFADMKYGLDPKFRFTASRAVYKGILRYLNGYDATVQPLPVKQVGITTDGILRWKAERDSLEPTATPTYYMVYIQANDGEWDVQQVEKKTECKVQLKPGVKYNYYVVAGNDGGLSLPSPVISAYLNDTKPVLVIDGFDDAYGVEWFADSTFAGIVPGSYACEDYFSCAYIGEQFDFRRSNPWINDDNCGWGACYRDHAGQLTVGNTHDYSVLHGRMLRKMKLSYVSCTAGMMDTYHLQPTEYRLIDYICGRQRKPLNEVQQQAIAAYLQSGGRLLLSTDHFSAIDASWALTNLHASYYAANASRSGRITSPRHRVYQLYLEPNEEQLFTCKPEGLRADVVSENTTPSPLTVFASYEDMRCPAGIGWKTKTPMSSTLVFGFPLEAVMDFDKIYRHSIEWLLSD